MAIFDFEDNASIGTVFSVDTATLIVKVEELDKLRKLQVNHLVAIKSSKAGQYLIGIINRITRKATDDEQPVGEDLGLNNFLFTENILKVNLIGTLLNKHGEKENVFKRTLDTVPEIEAKCFPYRWRKHYKVYANYFHEREISNTSFYWEIFYR